MNKNILTKIKELISLADKLSRLGLANGGEIEFEGEQLAVGTAVYVVTESGNSKPANGDLELVDGTIVSVSDGKVTSITESVPEPDLVSTAVPPEEPELADEVPSPEFIALEERVSALEAQIEQLLSVNQSLSSSLEAKLSAVDAKVTKVVNHPSIVAMKYEEVQTTFNKTETKSRAQKILSSKLN